ncbi:hypothetical protein ENBRE01_1613 [Enteropsectra breve]|nr:hypothetical protein ENBRE01_1613 [Enteropsectra breve]
MQDEIEAHREVYIKKMVNGDNWGGFWVKFSGFMWQGEFYNAIQNEEKALEFAVNLSLISLLRKPCVVDGRYGYFNAEKGKKRHGINMRWRCNKRNCRKTVSILQNTIFTNSNYTISQVLELIYLYCENLDIGEKARAMGIDRHSASQFMKRLDNIFINYCLISEEKIRSRRSIVEIDETHLFTRKYNNG